MQNTSNIIRSIQDNPDPDAMVMWHLSLEGSDLSKPHKPDFAFSSNNEKDANSISILLSKMGFIVTVYPPDDEHPSYEVTGVTKMILELDVLNQLSAKFEEIAKQFYGEYLGWGAEVVE